MTKTHILSEIKRTATANGGVPLGKRRFASETGIKESDWFGKFWTRWSEALREAGLTPNRLQGPYDRAGLLDKYAMFVQELGRLPTSGELRLKRHADSAFPSHNVFAGRLGNKAQLLAALHEHCQDRTEYADVVRLCDSHLPSSRKETDDTEPSNEQIGFVYLIKSGRFYKIGRSNAAGRRQYELAIQLPEKVILVHQIKTDDPAGIEAYWHNRFKERRKNGEWFELKAADVSAFKRRKFM